METCGVVGEGTTCGEETRGCLLFHFYTQGQSQSHNPGCLRSRPIGAIEGSCSSPGEKPPARIYPGLYSCLMSRAALHHGDIRWMLKVEALLTPSLEPAVSSARSIRLGRPDIIHKLEYSFHFVNEKPHSLWNSNRQQTQTSV